MGTLNESPAWPEGVRYFEADSVLTGGPDCPDNLPIQDLANRTAYLRKVIGELSEGKQAFDATLTALAAMVFSADKFAYAIGEDKFALADLTPFARSLLDDADAAAARATLGVSGALQNAEGIVSVAGGTADAITGTFSTPITQLSNGMTLYVRAGFANATTTPTFTPKNGTIAAKAIVKGAGAALVAGDISGSGHWIELQYDLTLDKWVLLNPAFGFAATAAKFDRSTKSATTEFAMRALGNFSGVIQYNASQDLSADNDIGKLLVCGGAGPYTLTLPAANSCPAGASIWIMSQAATVTIQRLGTNAISLGPQNSLTSVTIGQGDFLCMTNYNGTDTWYVSLGTPLLKVGGVTGIFGASIGASGFKMHPSGLIKQYGVASSLSSDEVRVITLPTSFKTAMRVPLLTGDGASPLVRVHALGLSSFQIQNKGTAGQNVYWEVEGS